jgi:hypothetical protein
MIVVVVLVHVVVVAGDGVDAPEDSAMAERMPSRHWATTTMIMMMTRNGSKESRRARASWLDIIIYALKTNEEMMMIK